MGQTEPLGEGCHRSRWPWKRDALNGRYSSHSVTLGEVGAAGGGMEGPRARSGRAEVRSMTCRAAVRAAAANSQRAGYRVSGGGGGGWFRTTFAPSVGGWGPPLFLEGGTAA